MKQIVYSLILLIVFSLAEAQDTLLPLQMNPEQVLASSEEKLKKGEKAASRFIPVNLDTSKFIIVDDFSYNNFRPNPAIWKDRSVYVNRNFPIKPVSIGVATFDGLDRFGYPYNFSSPTSYGACDTLTSWPIQLSKVDRTNDDPIYLTFLTQPQGYNPFPNSPGDSISLEFYTFRLKYDTTLITDTGGTIIDTILSVDTIDNWIRVWGRDGTGSAPTTACKTAFKSKTIKIDTSFYRDNFQFRFLTFGNTSGSVDHWHLDFVIMSSDPKAHTELNDYAFQDGIGSLIEEYESMPWFHYVGNENRYDRTKSATYKIRNYTNESFLVDLEYRADDESGSEIDSYIKVFAYNLFANTCANHEVPFTTPPNFKFKFPSSSAPKNSTTFFLKKSILKNRNGPADIIQLNNQVDEYQLFGTYYAYDDGSAEAGYGVKSDKGEVAVQFVMPEGVEDTLTSFYIHFNPVVIDRSESRFRLTVWDNKNGEPGSIIYENSTVSSPIYPKKGVNFFQRWFLDKPVIVSDTFYIGYQKITESPLNIGYDVNRQRPEKLFFNVGGAWIQGGSVEKGSLMIRPSFRYLEDPEVGIPSKKNTKSAEFKVYPNPVRNTLFIEDTSNNQDSWNGQVYALDGRMTDSFIITGRTEIDVSNYSKGMHILRLVNAKSGQSTHYKFLVTE